MTVIRLNLNEEEASRVKKGFLLTPFALVPLGLFTWLVAIYWPDSVIAGVSPWFVFSPVVAFPIAILIGLPLWIMVRRLKMPNLFISVLGAEVSALLGGAMSYILLAPSLPVALDNLLSEGVTREAALLAILGLAYGIVFWLIAYRGSGLEAKDVQG
jgi:hypothetical protein